METERLHQIILHRVEMLLEQRSNILVAHGQGIVECEQVRTLRFWCWVPWILQRPLLVWW